MGEGAATRAAPFGDGWFILAAPPDIPGYQALAAERAATRGRPAPAITTNAIVALDGDPHLPGRDVLMRLITEPDGMFGIPADQATGALVTGGPAAVAGHLRPVSRPVAPRPV